MSCSRNSSGCDSARGVFLGGSFEQPQSTSTGTMTRIDVLLGIFTTREADHSGAGNASSLRPPLRLKINEPNMAGQDKQTEQETGSLLSFEHRFSFFEEAGNTLFVILSLEQCPKCLAYPVTHVLIFTVVRPPQAFFEITNR